MFGDFGNTTGEAAGSSVERIIGDCEISDIFGGDGATRSADLPTAPNYVAPRANSILLQGVALGEVTKADFVFRYPAKARATCLA